MNQILYNEALSILKDAYGGNASFRDGQYEAIESVVSGKRTLVVQKTGWGKSLVYFLSTKLLRRKGYGTTFVISPLLVLMQNQVEAAEKIGLKCELLNSETKERHDEILEKIKRNQVDVVFITPETLFNEKTQKALKDIEIGFFVVDEAHCISDWGHDFRLEYSRLKNIISRLPDNVPLLATTATANQRVVDDLKKQLGGNIEIFRGSLARESLLLQTIKFSSKAERYAWILENLNALPGSGIIYCSTRGDCDALADFLSKNGLKVAAYHSGCPKEENAENEKRFKNNELKALIATTKLGMGYDKGDIAFVIHFQMPQNIVSYYQQIGRAGRKLDAAYAIMLHDESDIQILEHFINTAFPSEAETVITYNQIFNSNGINLDGLIARLNARRNRILKILDFLINDGYVRKDGSKYYVNPVPFKYDRQHYDAITSIRRQEMRELIKLTKTKECLSKFTIKALGDNTASECHKCSNCLGRDLVPTNVSQKYLDAAKEFIENRLMPIEPRKQWPDRKKIKEMLQPGFAIAKYGNGYGLMVKQDKTQATPHFRDELVEKGAKVISEEFLKYGVKHLAFVPSLRNNAVKDYAERLAKACGLTFVDLLYKTEAEEQKKQENSFFQCKNALGSFHVKPGIVIPDSIILVDDIVDSKWTLTACGYKIITAAAKPVKIYPFAIADSSNEDSYE